MFEDGSENKPASMIITTLSAHTYEGDTILESTMDKIGKMPNFS